MLVWIVVALVLQCHSSSHPPPDAVSPLLLLPGCWLIQAVSCLCYWSTLIAISIYLAPVLFSCEHSSTGVLLGFVFYFVLSLAATRVILLSHISYAHPSCPDTYSVTYTSAHRPATLCCLYFSLTHCLQSTLTFMQALRDFLCLPWDV